MNKRNDYDVAQVVKYSQDNMIFELTIRGDYNLDLNRVVEGMSDREDFKDVVREALMRDDYYFIHCALDENNEAGSRNKSLLAKLINLAREHFTDDEFVKMLEQNNSRSWRDHQPILQKIFATRNYHLIAEIYEAVDAETQPLTKALLDKVHGGIVEAVTSKLRPERVASRLPSFSQFARNFN